MKYQPILLLSACVAFSSCANSTHMFLAQETHLGFQGSVDPQNSSAKIHIGYHRAIATVIPKVDRGAATAPPDPENMDAGSVLVASRASFRYLNIPEIDEFVATGGAANNLASNEDAKALFTNIRGPGAKVPQAKASPTPTEKQDEE